MSFKEPWKQLDPKVHEAVWKAICWFHNNSIGMTFQTLCLKAWKLTPELKGKFGVPDTWRACFQIRELLQWVNWERRDPTREWHCAMFRLTKIGQKAAEMRRLVSVDMAEVKQLRAEAKENARLLEALD